MPWYTAHIVMSIKFHQEKQERYPICEDLILIEAQNNDQAWIVAENQGRSREYNLNNDKGYTYDGIPAMIIYTGVKKIILCENSEEVPGNGTEVSYSLFELSSEKDIEEFINNKKVLLLNLE